MTRRLPPPWHADKFSGGYVVRDANGFAVAYVYGRSTEAEALEAKQMTMDEETCRIKHRQATGHVEARGINRTSKASPRQFDIMQSGPGWRGPKCNSIN